MGVGTGRIVRIFVEEFLRRVLRSTAVLSDERTHIKEKARPGVDERVEARIVLPNGLVPLRMSENGPKACATKIEEAAREVHRERCRRHLHQDGALF